MGHRPNDNDGGLPIGDEAHPYVRTNTGANRCCSSIIRFIIALLLGNANVGTWEVPYRSRSMPNRGGRSQASQGALLPSDANMQAEVGMPEVLNQPRSILGQGGQSLAGQGALLPGDADV